MSTNNWKSTALLAVISALTLVLLVSGLASTIGRPLLTSTGILSLLIRLLLTLEASRLTISVTSADGVRRSRKSVADSFVFLAVMLYAIPPASVVGPAVLLAALVGFASTYRIATRRETIFTTGLSAISTFVAASLYGLLVARFAERAHFAADGSLSLDVLLVPLFTLAALQYLLSTIATAWFLSIDAGRLKLLPSQESLVWTLTTQLAGAASAVLFYFAIRDKGFS